MMSLGWSFLTSGRLLRFGTTQPAVGGGATGAAVTEAAGGAADAAFAAAGGGRRLAGPSHRAGLELRGCFGAAPFGTKFDPPPFCPLPPDGFL
mmetsp:Transcript_83978/g.271402  ORF Transcript_83978/g.271402 Transcript_83978/m.271402 type:complete len:93 (+) Transcript_83978:2284-2562(+)